MSNNRKQKIAIVQILVCSALWSIAGIFIKLIPWNAFAIAGFRSLIAASTVFVFLRITRQKIIVSKDTLLSMVFLSSTSLCFVSANKLTTAANAIVLQFTAPVFIVVSSALFFGHRYKKSEIAATAATVVGVAIFFIDSIDRGRMMGNILAIASGMTLAGMFIAVGKTGEEEKMSGILFGHLMTTVVGIPFFFLADNEVTPLSLISIVILGVVQLGIPYILFGMASAYCPPLACSLISAVEPLLNPVWVMLFYDERPGPAALVGGAIIIAAVTAQCVMQERESRLTEVSQPLQSPE